MILRESTTQASTIMSDREVWRVSRRWICRGAAGLSLGPAKIGRAEPNGEPVSVTAASIHHAIHSIRVRLPI